jgi:ADA HAT complex component 1
MLSNFRLPWCNEQQMLPKMSSDMLPYSAAVDMPMFGKFKRQLPEADAHHSAQQTKKPRLEVETSRPAPAVHARPVVKSGASPAVQLPTPVTPIVPRPVIAAPATPVSEPVKAAAPVAQTAPAAPAPVQTALKETPRQKVSTAPPALDCIADMTPLQQVIDNEFNMAMLMKHNELRLIEQELAKCQVALEQLRRCELKPYPGYDTPSSEVTEGTGPAILPGSGMSRPAYPAPYGVTDGPYSRHYRQWLLCDPEFDSMPMHMYSSMDTPTSAGGRSTRNLGSARKSVSSRTHAVTNRIDSLPSIPNYPAPAPKDKSAPLVLRRSTDNQLVKLICNNCLRGNFSSIQGFLNHCRIAHKVDYKSHDLAAIDCGRLLDEADLAKLPAETHALPVAGTPTPKPHASRANSSASSKMAAAAAASTPTASTTSKTLPALHVSTPAQPREMVKGFVHALNSPVANLPTPPASVVRKRAPVKSSPAFQVKSGSSATLPPPALQISTSTTDKPSNLPPRLLAHFAKQGGRPEMFAQAFANAKQSMDETFAQYACEPAMMTPICTPSEEDADSPLMFQRQPQKNSVRPARPSLLIAPATAGDASASASNSAPSPSTTSSLSHANSPHLLPGLVSDHEGEEEDDNDDHSHLDDHDHHHRHDEDDVMMVDSVVDLDSHFANAVQHSDHDLHHGEHHRHCRGAAGEESDCEGDVVVVARKNGMN